MDDSSSSPQQTMSMWITSLAISVTCCAILFVIFAGYLTEIKRNVASESAQLDQMAAHQDQLLLEIKTLQRTLAQQNAGATPPAVVPPSPPPAPPAPPSAAVPPAPEAAPVGTSAITPPAIAPTAIPEVPAKK